MLYKNLSIFAILFVLASCQNNTEDKQTTISKKDSITIAVNPVQSSPKIDSIEKTNAATINRDGDDIQKATISKKDSSIFLTANMKMDHRIFGYEKPDTNSNKLILISIFTDDVKDNPFHLQYGAYYETSDMKNEELKFVGNEGDFIKANIIKDNKIEGTVFIKKNWVEFDD